MDTFFHSDEIDNMADIDFNTFDPEKLNPLEQLGLYLIGQISRGKLCELWKCGFVSANEIVFKVFDSIKPYLLNLLKEED